MQLEKKLRYGWTTGACATAAAKAAYLALLRGFFMDYVTITLPQGKRVSFRLEQKKRPDKISAIASVIKDAGDDPDITHGAEIVVQVKRLSEGSGIQFKAGKGVGIITKSGLQLPVGEPAINPVPRKMIKEACKEVRENPDILIEIGIVNGDILAQKTMNPRLGIIGGLSILGTTGIVVPFSCSAWIASIHRGIDVARAMGLKHLIASTGSVSEEAARQFYSLPDSAFIEMGDFVGGVLKYLKIHPIERLTLAGGIAKFTKLAQGNLDLHSKRSSVDFDLLAEWAGEIGADLILMHKIKNANTVLEVFNLCGNVIPLGDLIARKSLEVVEQIFSSVSFEIEIMIFDRQGRSFGRVINLKY